MLFNPLQTGSVSLANRILMAPLTRARADAGHMPNALMAEYYSQRATAGLIVTECTMVAENTSAFYAEPGIYNAEQIAAWKVVTDAVHAKGGKIFMQIWHAGRAAVPAFNNGVENVGPSAIAIDSEVHTPDGKVPNAVPRELRLDEIPALVAAYAQGAKNAIAAGFDGVEVHGANGYLIDQFLRDSANTRTDSYGGSIENRARFLFEVLTAVSDAIGSDKVGLRLSPINSYNSMKDSDPLALISYLTTRLNEYNLAYLHLMRSDFFQAQTGDVMTVARANYKGVLIGNMGYNADEAAQAISNSALDAVAFGTSFLANPDLPARIKQGAALNAPDAATFYTPGAKGYTDYPSLQAA
ncbi:MULTISPECIES: alkene reductase [Undibacterium]|jgi:N-ethylmaleimide reductase|uniref:Alkene reductase n=1 Tax=Undibacterium umbellatum TaxID=2762300 RepID=A0ABR6ZIB9_9BURK|nr:MULTISPECIES: alkene reductase [Undibacterium]MBC3911449.1 alkene reductase [Undibacterium umbellatum]MDP1978324.1 alkene reductase [Undibacterium sp.]